MRTVGIAVAERGARGFPSVPSATVTGIDQLVELEVLGLDRLQRALGDRVFRKRQALRQQLVGARLHRVGREP